MINQQFGVPQHELNVISCMLRDRRVAFNQFVDWNHSTPRYWLRADHFQTRWLGEIYDTLLIGGIDDIEHRLQAYPGADPAQVIADAVLARLSARYQQMAAAGDPEAWETLHNSDYWAGMHHAVRTMAASNWPAATDHARHEAYITVHAAQHPSGTAEVPFELARGRAGDLEARHKEVAIIGAILNDPARAEQFRYTPSSRDDSPYWLHPQDFGDPITAEIWDALVTGPDPAIALPAATDPTLTRQQRAQAMIEHIYLRLSYNDYHRSTADPEAKARLDNHTNRTIAQCLAAASSPDFSPDPDRVGQYALHFVLEPSIPATVDTLAGEIRQAGLADTSLGQVAVELMNREYALEQLQERLDQALRVSDIPTTSDQAPAPAPATTPADGPDYASRDIERRVVISLIQDPTQLHRDGPVRSLTQQDFTQPEHAYLFKALQALPPGAAADPWILTNHAHRLALHDSAPALSHDELHAISYAARTLQAAPADQGANHLVTMTVRRAVRDASTAIQAVAQQATTNPGQLIGHSLAQLRQATREALRHHEQSVPQPSWHTAPHANAV